MKRRLFYCLLETAAPSLFDWDLQTVKEGGV